MRLSLKELLILKLATILKINLKGLAYKGVGIGLPNSFAENGEKFLMDLILPKILKNGSRKIIFDIGANIGDYTENLSKRFLEANIYSFEPNPYAFQVLNRRFGATENVIKNNFALGATRGKDNLFFYSADKTTGHASINLKVFELHKRTDLNSSEINIETIDNFCSDNNIDRVDFMKIDTEGFEYNVLLGAKKMINSGQISFIQFEFNEMNITSRIFLKDFYDLLPGYEFYRLKQNCLFPLKEYSSKEEVFIIQNLLAVNKKFTKENGILVD